MKRINGKLVKPEPWEAKYSQLFVNAEREKYMEAINRQRKEISEHLITINKLMYKIEQLEKDIEWLEEEAVRSYEEG